MWYHTLGIDQPVRKELSACLKAIGLDRHPYRREGKVKGAGVVFLRLESQDFNTTCVFVRDISQSGRKRILIVFLSDHELTPGQVWRLLDAGAADILPWNMDNLAGEIQLRLNRWAKVDRVIKSPLVQDNLVGQSTVWTNLLRQVVEVALFTDLSILILGESGTGKELIARLVNTIDARRKGKDLIVLDCTTIVPELSGSEFFGHERGAFTGASSSRDGAFCLANEGTLFLDEIGELPLDLQAQLLRVVQEGQYKRVGGDSWQLTEFRLVSATNKDLDEEVREGRFRGDLFHRITGWVCKTPPLKDRLEDIPLLARHFLRQLSEDRDPPALEGHVLQYLLTRAYPGNVRELQQLVGRLHSRHVGCAPITPGDIPREERPGPGRDADRAPWWSSREFRNCIRRGMASGAKLKEIGSKAEDVAIQLAIEEEGTLKAASRKLGVTDRTLQLRRSQSGSRSSRS